MRRQLKATALGLTLIAGFALSAEAKTLVYCSEGSPEGFNPSLYSAGTTFDASAQAIYNRLVEFEPGTTTLVPGLAESWSSSEDGLVYTFKLRQGVKWHANDKFTPGRDFNADDILYSFNRQWDVNHPYHPVSGGKYQYFGWMDMANILKSIEKVDDHTVRFTLNYPEAPFVSNLAMDFASIMSAEYADKMTDAKETVDNEPIGTGPFVFKSYQKDAVIRYEAFADYWEGKPPADKLVFAITTDPSVRYQKLKAGECHIMPYPNPADLADMEANADIDLLEQEGLNVGYLAFNTEKEPFNNKAVRQALNMAINKQAIIDVVFKGAATAAINPIPPTIWSYNDAITDYEYDPETAKQMLKDAGVSGLKTNIWAMPVQRPYNPNARRMAELIQADWAKVGVEAEIVTFEWAEYLDRVRKGEHDTVLLGWTGDNGDPDNFMFVLLGCEAAKSSSSRWCNRDFDDLLRDAKKTSNIEERTAFYKDAQKIFKEEAPWVTIAHSIVFKPIRKEVTGFKVHPLGSHIFKFTDIQ